MIYDRLLNEGTDVWRPSPAKHIRDDIYQITGSPPDETEKWQFSTGDKVHRQLKTFGDGKTELVAFGRAWFMNLCSSVFHLWLKLI